MNDKIIEDMKFNYNYLLMRYKKGCCYIEKNMGEFDEWITTLTDVLDNMVIILDELLKYIDISDDEILNGFKLKGENNHGIG